MFSVNFCVIDYNFDIRHNFSIHHKGYDNGNKFVIYNENEKTNIIILDSNFIIIRSVCDFHKNNIDDYNCSTRLYFMNLNVLIT